ncbi:MULTISPECIES: hypothetical protein [Rhodobacterales]|uniref:hypothetical protein n=1 Tax=Rhodobacterales TaxID=204455 RepID=UPI0011BD77ED|nr:MULTISPECIES: hypothetical protein [Rhodobacterales]MDO6589510.1 hypothetical protein [Yoonia sp. 1_MG-2023]
MSHNWSDIRVTQGSLEDARLPTPLRCSDPHIRPGNLADNFVRLAANAPAPWDKMLRSEPLLVAAQIVAFRIDDELTRFDLALEQGADTAAREIRNLAQQLDDWIIRLRAQWPGEFAAVLQGLDQQMNLSDRAHALARASGARMIAVMQNKGFIPAATGDNIVQARACQAGLSAAHRQLVHAIASLKPVAQLGFDRRLKSGLIDPAIGLMIAELSAAQQVDARLNRFTERHSDFYYGEIIGQPRRGAAPDRALLHLPSGTAPKLLAKGTPLTAQLADGSKLHFQTEVDVPITPAKVIATAALSYDTDPQISLFSTLGSVTGVRGGFEPAEQQPLDRSVFVGPANQDIDMGLDIASQMFQLSEGHRQIDVSFNLQRATDLPAATPSGAIVAQTAPDPDIALELRSDPTLIRALGFDNLNAGVAAIAAQVHSTACARDCGASMDLIYEVIAGKILTVSALRILLGRIVTLGLVENNPWPTGSYWDTLKTRILACETALTGQHNPGAATGDIGQIVEAFGQENGQFIYSPADMFEKLLGDAFHVTLSTAQGPMPAKLTQIIPKTDGTPGFLIRLTYAPDMPAITSDKENAPVLSFRWDQQSRVCPISFFERYTLDQVGIAVRVDGLTQLSGFSDDGPVATAQSFMPFGARPNEGATFTVASAEMAAKPVTGVHMRLRWADVPDKPGGFATYYRGYPDSVTVPDPTVRAEYLVDAAWKPITDAPGPMIPTNPYDGTLIPEWALTAPVQGSDSIAPLYTHGSLPKNRAKLRAGALRLTLRGGGDFGQAQHPLALVKAMRPNPVPLRPRVPPNPPWIPRIESLSLGYTAASVMTLAAPDTAQPGDKITQITPFGARPAFPNRIRRNLGLFPPRLGLGTLYIQLAGKGALRQLGILFDIADSGHLRLVPPPVPLDWYYLTADGWTDLPPTAISSDTTDGLLRSGVVTLDLPNDAHTPAGEMPEGGVWVAVSAPWRGFETHPTLSRVRTNGVWAVSTESDALPAAGDRQWRFNVPQPGMSAPQEAARRAPPKPPETRPDYLARVGERLRHRQRAVTPFDIERLVLNVFPDVWRCKCLPHLSRKSAAPRPGTATVVIVRHPPEFAQGAQQHAQERYFDVGTLERVRAFLHRHGSPNAQYEVVNPAFDRLHVRAALRFVPFQDDGALANKLQHYVSQCLSVWTGGDDIARFGWQVNVPMLKAQIAAHPDVLGITDFSVLHFVADDSQHYALGDTAQDDARGPLGSIIRPSRPWALPLSAKSHAISTSERKQPIAPTQSGIGRLRIGDMLIVGQEGHP